MTTAASTQDAWHEQEEALLGATETEAGVLGGSDVTLVA